MYGRIIWPDLGLRRNAHCDVPLVLHSQTLSTSGLPRESGHARLMCCYSCVLDPLTGGLCQPQAAWKRGNNSQAHDLIFVETRGYHSSTCTCGLETPSSGEAWLLRACETR